MPDTQVGAIAPEIQAAIDLIEAEGKGGDIFLAHINASEAMLLMKSGGSGTVNSSTGLPQFNGGGTGGGPADADADADFGGFGSAAEQGFEGEQGLGAGQQGQEPGEGEQGSAGAIGPGGLSDAQSAAIEANSLSFLGALTQNIQENPARNATLAALSIPGMLAINAMETSRSRDTSQFDAFEGVESQMAGTSTSEGLGATGEGGDPGQADLEQQIAALQQDVAEEQEITEPVSLFDTIFSEILSQQVFGIAGGLDFQLLDPSFGTNLTLSDPLDLTSGVG